MGHIWPVGLILVTPAMGNSEERKQNIFHLGQQQKYWFQQW